MRFFSIVVSVFALLLMMGCGKDEIQIPNQPLKGMVAGESWELKFSNAYIFSSDLKYQIRFLSQEEVGNDPCAIATTGNRHVSMIFPLRIGSFSLPLPDNQESARFHFGPGNSSIATSGFLEIFDIDNSRIIGFMQAQLDDQNMVEGTFEVQICN